MARTAQRKPSFEHAKPLYKDFRGAMARIPNLRREALLRPTRECRFEGSSKVVAILGARPMPVLRRETEPRGEVTYGCLEEGIKTLMGLVKEGIKTLRKGVPMSIRSSGTRDILKRESGPQAVS